MGASAYPMAVSEIPPPPPRPTEFSTLAEFREYLKAVQVNMYMYVCIYVCMYVCMIVCMYAKLRRFSLLKGSKNKEKQFCLPWQDLVLVYLVLV